MGEVFFNTDVDKTVDIDKNVFLNVNKNVDADVDIDGWLATAEASADGVGPNTLAETDTFAQATTEASYSFSEALAAVDPGEVPIPPEPLDFG